MPGFNLAKCQHVQCVKDGRRKVSGETLIGAELTGLLAALTSLENGGRESNRFNGIDPGWMSFGKRTPANSMRSQRPGNR